MGGTSKCSYNECAFSLGFSSRDKNTFRKRRTRPGRHQKDHSESAGEEM